MQWLWLFHCRNGWVTCYSCVAQSMKWLLLHAQEWDSCMSWRSSITVVHLIAKPSLLCTFGRVSWSRNAWSLHTWMHMQGLTACWGSLDVMRFSAWASARLQPPYYVLCTFTPDFQRMYGGACSVIIIKFAYHFSIRHELQFLVKQCDCRGQHYSGPTLAWLFREVASFGILYGIGSLYASCWNFSQM